jgi:hypothetical protein
MNIDLRKGPINAKMHIYEAIPGTFLSRVSLAEKNIYGLGSARKTSWVQFHPLTRLSAAVLIQEPCLSKSVPVRYLQRHHLIAVGQRFYYLEIPGGKVKLKPTPSPIITPQATVIPQTTVNTAPIILNKPQAVGQSDIQLVINFLKAEIRFNYYFSQNEAQRIADNLNQGDYLIGLSNNIRTSFRDVLSNILIRNIGSKVKLIHEAYPEMYINELEMNEQEQFAPLAVAANAAKGLLVAQLMKILEKIIQRLADFVLNAVANFFKGRKQEFLSVQRGASDGVTIKITFMGIPGMSQLRLVLKLLRDPKNTSLGDVNDFLSLPGVMNIVPDVKVFPNKQFD